MDAQCLKPRPTLLLVGMSGSNLQKSEMEELPVLDGAEMHAELTNPNTLEVIKRALKAGKSIIYVQDGERVYVYCE